jgi:uncharacterized protein
MKNTDKKNISVENSQIKIFATSQGIIAIKSPVRVKILTMLREGELSFDDIVKLSNKAKSTVSSHLKAMVKEGIINSRIDPMMPEKKYFSSNQTTWAN